MKLYKYDPKEMNCMDPNCKSCNPDGVVNKVFLNSPTGKHLTQIRKKLLGENQKKEKIKKLIIYSICTLIVLVLTLYAILTMVIVMTDILPGNCNYILDFLVDVL